MSETSLIFLSLIYFEIFQNKTSRQKDRRGEKRVRVEDKRKSRLLKISDVVSVNLVTTLVATHVVVSVYSIQPEPGRNIFMIFYYLESKHFLWWWRVRTTTNLPAVSFFPLNIRPRVYSFSSSQMIL